MDSPLIALGIRARRLPVILLLAFGEFLAPCAAVADQAGFLAERTEHFAVTYPAEDAALIPPLLEALERAYQSLGATLEVYPRGPIPVAFSDERGTESDLAPARMLGRAAGASISIRSAADPDVASTLVHELAHVFTHAIAGGLPRWLDEGVAAYFQRRLTDDPPHRPGLARILPPFAAAPYTSGTVAVEYMIDRYGMRRLVDLLKRVGEYRRDPYYAGGEKFAPAFRRLFGMDASDFEDQVRVAYWSQRSRGESRSGAPEGSQDESRRGEAPAESFRASADLISP